jgi:prepilin-type N-terminal cleavage/methylation domain-containing protein
VKPYSPKNAAEQGFSLMEVLVSLGVFGIFSASLMAGLQSFLSQTHTTAIRTEAVAVAIQMMDSLREQDPDTLPTSGTIGPENVVGGNREFHVYTSYCSKRELCPSPRTKHISLDIQYRGETVYNAESVFTQLR